MGNVWSSIKYYKVLFLKLFKLHWKGIFLWSNCFYGICAVLLSIESTLYIAGCYPSFWVLSFIYLSTVVYYTNAYLNESKHAGSNERIEWYRHHMHYIQLRQIVYSICIVYIVQIQLKLFSLLFNAVPAIQILIAALIFLATAYYLPFNIFNKKTIRNIGMLKSIVIALVWSIVCYIVPIWITVGPMGLDYFATSIFYIHFSQLFIFILVLAILFDIKDINRDKDAAVNTIVLQFGIKDTIYRIIPALVLVYLILSFSATLNLHYNFMYFLMQCSIAGGTLLIAKYVIQKKSIPTNILFIDGLMIIKAILSISFFRIFMH